MPEVGQAAPAARVGLQVHFVERERVKAVRAALGA